MARVSLRDKVDSVNVDIKDLVKSLGRAVVDNPAALELVYLLSRKTGQLDALVGIDRVENGLPYDGSPVTAATVSAGPSNGKDVA